MTIREAGHTAGRIEYRATVQTVEDAARATNSLDLIQEMTKIAHRDVKEAVVGLDLSRA